MDGRSDIRVAQISPKSRHAKTRSWHPFANLDTRSLQARY